MHIETSRKRIPKSQETVYNFLMDVNNFEQLMPDTISKFEVYSDEKFMFALKGMPEIILVYKERVPHGKVVLGAASDKIPFTLTAHISEESETESEVVLSFEGEFNAMMAMMIKKPITSFIDTLSDNLQKI